MMPYQRRNHRRQFRSYDGGKAGRRQPRRAKTSFATQLLMAALLAAITGWTLGPRLTSAWTLASASPDEISRSEQSVYYRNCAAARAAGAAPIHAGEPGYRDSMDGDGDGIACEPYRGW